MRMVLLSVDHKPWGLERFYFPFHFCQRESPFAQCQGHLPPAFDTAFFRVGVLAVVMRIPSTAWHCWFH